MNNNRFWDTYTSHYGNTYVGEYKNVNYQDFPAKDGLGVMKYANGDIYIGEWESNNESGFGLSYKKTYYGICWY